MPKILAVKNPELREKLQAPFDLVRINQKNPEKNLFRIPQNIPYVPSDPRYFFYRADGISKQSGGVAGFAKEARAIDFGSEFDSSNLLNMLIVYHELVHVNQDVEMRMAIDSPEKGRWYQEAIKALQRPRVYINLELEAHGLMVEMLNLVLDGELKNKIAYLDSDSLDLWPMLQKLHAKGNQQERDLLMNILVEAQKYYPEASFKFDRSNRFTQLLIDELGHNSGKEVYLQYPGQAIKKVDLDK